MESTKGQATAPTNEPVEGRAKDPTTGRAGEPLKVAVVTGRHPFDVISFHALFRAMPGIDPYIQHIEHFTAEVPENQECRRRYDAVVFYHMNQAIPQDDDLTSVWMRSALGRLGETEQGIVVLHHAILAFPDWQPWSDLCGIQDRRFGFHMDQELAIEIADPHHPIVEGVKPWTLRDESYTMNSPGDDSHILLTTSHPKSMTAIAWTRTYKKARVFCFQSGHGDSAFSDPTFRTILRQGIEWAAGRR